MAYETTIGLNNEIPQNPDHILEIVTLLIMK